MGKIDACVVQDQLWATITSLATQGPGSWTTYEVCKRCWVDANPNPQPDDYDAAMSRIRRLAGITLPASR